MNNFIKTVLVGTGVALFIKYLTEYGKRSSEFVTVGEGKFSHVNLHVQVDGCESGRVRPRNTFSIVFMEDGSSFIIDGFRDFPFSKGTLIRIEENVFGHRQIVRQEVSAS